MSQYLQLIELIIYKSVGLSIISFNLANASARKEILFSYCRWRKYIDELEAAQWIKQWVTDPSTEIRKRREEGIEVRGQKLWVKNWEREKTMSTADHNWCWPDNSLGRVSAYTFPMAYPVGRDEGEKNLRYRKKSCHNHRTKPWCETHFLLLPSYFTSKESQAQGSHVGKWPPIW